MSNFIQYYEYSKLASAAYVNLMNLNEKAVAKEVSKAERLPEALANQTFDPNSKESKISGSLVWKVPEGGFYGNDGEGFAATLFERAGQKVLAIRGTEPTENLYSDLLKADITQIGFLGLALGQALSMVNFIRRLQASKTQDVQQLTWSYSPLKPDKPGISLPDGKGYIYFTEQPAKKGLGLVGPNEKIEITGHSLGGHLAALGARLFPQLFNGCYIFNAPGFDPDTADIIVPLSRIISPALATAIAVTGNIPLKLTDEFVSLVGDYLTTTPAKSFSQVQIHNLESEDIDPGDDTSFISSVVTGTHNLPAEINIPTERNSHMVEPLMDSLSMQALLSRMKPDITAGEIETLFRATSTSNADVLEKLVVQLRDVLLGKGTSSPAIADAQNLLRIGTGDFEARKQYY